MKTYKVTVDEGEFKIDKNDINSLDICQVAHGDYHILKDNKAFSIQLISVDYKDKKVRLAVNGNTYEIAIQDKYDQVVEKMGLLTNTSQKVRDIKAPMPGLIISVMVQEGQEITEGTPLLVLSAMKMENQILSQGSGVIKSIAIAAGDAVEKGQVIIEME